MNRIRAARVQRDEEQTRELVERLHGSLAEAIPTEPSHLPASGVQQARFQGE